MFEQSFLKRAVKANDIPALRKFLQKKPEYLEEPLSWHVANIRGTGPLLCMAAGFNKPEIIEFLVKEKGVSVNQREKHQDLWAPVHYAFKLGAYDAAVKLLALGADPMAKTADGKIPRYLTKSAPMIALVTDALLKGQAEKPAEAPAAERRSAAAKRAHKATPVLPVDRWTRPSAEEVIRERVLPDAGLRLTDIFNFEGRYWQSIVRDGANLAEKIVFFDEMPDKAAARQAHARYKGLGGTIPQEMVDSGLVKSKPPSRG